HEGLPRTVVVHRGDPLVIEADRLVGRAAGAAAPVIVTAARGEAARDQSDRESADEGASLHGHDVNLSGGAVRPDGGRPSSVALQGGRRPVPARSALPDQPLTEPSMTPLTKYFWRNG